MRHLGRRDDALAPARRPGSHAKGTSTIRPLFDGLFIEEKIEGALNGAPFTTLAWTGYNTATHQYEATRISSTNPMRIAETGGYDEKTGQFELKADYPLGRRHVAPAYRDPADVGGRDDRDQLSELRQGAGVEGGRNQVHAPGAVALTAARGRSPTLGRDDSARVTWLRAG